MDKIIVNGLEVFAYHGVNEEEKENGQIFVLDIVASVPLQKAGISDNLEDTVSYSKIIKLARSTMNEDKYDLIEKAAEQVARAILTEFTKVESVKVCLKKPQAPISAKFNYVAVTIERKRSDIM